MSVSLSDGPGSLCERASTGRAHLLNRAGGASNSTHNATGHLTSPPLPCGQIQHGSEVMRGKKQTEGGGGRNRGRRGSRKDVTQGIPPYLCAPMARLRNSCVNNKCLG